MSADSDEAGATEAQSEWRCRLCGHWMLVPAGSAPLAMLRQTAGQPRECVVRVGTTAVHRCPI